MRDHSIYIDEFSLIRPDNKYKATLCCCFFSHWADYEEIIQYLHPLEYDYYNSLEFEKRIKSYLMGRFVAKQAVSALTGKDNLKNIFIQSGIFNQPIVVSNMQNIQVSITHCNDFGAALAFPEAHPMGIDIEKISVNKRGVLAGQVTDFEKKRIRFLPTPYDLSLTLLWTAKEALSKVLKTGLMTPFDVFEVSKIEFYDNYILCYYKNFAQYKVISFTIAEYMCSIVHPSKTKMYFDIHSLKANFAFITSLNKVEETIL